MALTTTPPVDFAMPCPDFHLPTLDGKHLGLKDLPADTPFVVMFICNHCPYVQAIEDRLITLGKDLQKENIPVIAICANDEKSYPEDSFAALKANYLKKGMTFTYCHDSTQEVARAFGAVCTPDFFVFDRNHRLAYRGRLDDSWKDPLKVTRRDLFHVALGLKNKIAAPPPSAQIPSMGCSIKWIKS